MNSNARTIRKIGVSLCCVLLAAVVAVSWVSAADFEAPTVYVAGNPDLYPIEYYDASADQYCGLMPDLYARVAEQTGYTFQYLSPGSSNGQERMAKNGQAEIISAYLEGEIDPRYLQSPLPVTVIQAGQTEKTVCIAFTEIASETLIQDVAQAMNTISAAQKLEMLASHAAVNNYSGAYRIWIYILAGSTLLLLTVLVILLLFWRKQRKQSKKDTMIDPQYGIGNDQYYVYCFQNLISEKSKALYYIAHIAYDEQTFNQKFGDGENRNLQRYAVDFLSKKTGAVEYLAMFGGGVYAFVYQAANKAAAAERITSVITELNLHLASIKAEYANLFHGGVCALEENMDSTAETAFYSAKQGYQQAVSEDKPFAFSTKAMITQAHRKEGLHRRMLRAIADGEFTIYLQYIVDRQGRPVGAEATSRWQHPSEGLLPPSQYIAMISQSDVIAQHDFYIFSLVCKQLASWKDTSRRDLSISCNFTRYTLTSPSFFDQIKQTAEQYDFDRNKLIVEITEDSLSYDTGALRDNIQKCKDYGFCIALDDIGSGYSALSDLYDYPIDVVKVEREIVLQAMEPRGKMLLDGLIRLAHSMKIKVLCEGVETQAQNEMILDTECEYIQGFYYSRTLPLKEAERFLKQQGF